MSLGCPGIDVEAWQKANRAPVFTGKTNRWLFAANMPAGATDADLKHVLQDLFWVWFGTEDAPTETVIWVFAGGDEFECGSSDNVHIVSAAPIARRLTNTAQTREGIPGPTPSISSGLSLVYVEVTFTYRGQLTDVAWPVFSKSAWTKAGKTCPVNAQWVLLDVGNPGDTAPKARTIAERMTTGVAMTVKEVVTGAAEGLGMTGVITLGAGLALAIWLSGQLKKSK